MCSRGAQLLAPSLPGSGTVVQQDPKWPWRSDELSPKAEGNITQKEEEA